MSVDLFSGTPGSGKSLHLARVITDYCNRSRDSIVISNFEVNTSSFKHPNRFNYVPNDQLSTEFLLFLGRLNILVNKTYEKIENSIILIIDECQILFNARAWNEGNRSEWVKFFTQHRKMGYRVILVSQFDQMIDKQIRALIESEYIHRKMSSMGFLAFLLKCIFRHDLFLVIENYYPLKMKTGSELLIAKKRYTSIYNTSIIFDDIMDEG